jgi:hypothetical protein
MQMVQVWRDTSRRISATCPSAKIRNAIFHEDYRKKILNLDTDDDGNNKYFIPFSPQDVTLVRCIDFMDASCRF